MSLHEDYGFGFDLKFIFEPNHPYFLEQELTKKFTMSRQNVIEKTEQTKINWKEGQDPTRKKVKKKRKGKKVSVEVAADSFFTLFDQISMPTDDELKKGKLTITRKDLENPSEDQEQKDSVPDYKEEDIGERMDRDFQIGSDIRDELVPMALEYFLDVVDHGLSDDEDDLSDSEGEGGLNKFDEDGNKINKKKKAQEDCK